MSEITLWPAEKEAQRRIRSLDSFESLLVFLRNWSSAGDEQVYDLVGMLELASACLDNLTKNWKSFDDPDLLREWPSKQQVDFLRSLLDSIDSARFGQ